MFALHDNGKSKANDEGEHNREPTGGRERTNVSEKGDMRRACVISIISRAGSESKGRAARALEEGHHGERSQEADNCRYDDGARARPLLIEATQLLLSTSCIMIVMRRNRTTCMEMKVSSVL